MKQPTLFLITSLMLAACAAESPPPTQAQTLSWQQPDEAFRIGRGYDPDVIEPIRGDCIVHPEQYLSSNWLDAKGIKAEISETRITSKENLYKELNLAANAKVKYGAFGGGGSYAQYEKFTSSQEGFTWLFNLKVALGSQTLQTERITLESFRADAQQLIRAAQAGDTEARAAFARLCGSQFIRSVRLGGALTEVLEINAKAFDQVREITARMKASYGSGPFKVSGNASLHALFSQAEKYSLLKREFSQLGGDQILFDMTAANLQETIDAFVQSMKTQNAVVIEVEMVDWNTLIDFAPRDPLQLARSIKIDQLLKQLWRYQDHLDRLGSYLYLYERAVYSFSSSEVEGLRRDYQAVSEAIDQLIEVGKGCVIAESFCQQKLPLVTVHFPPVRQAPLADERELRTDRWRFSLPSGEGLMEIQGTGPAKIWRLPPLEDTASDGSRVRLQLDLRELSCSSIAEVLTPSGSEILASFEAEPIYYTESIRTFPEAEQRYSLNMAFKSGSDCLHLQAWSDPRAEIKISLVDDAALSRRLRRLAASVSLQSGAHPR